MNGADTCQDRPSAADVGGVRIVGGGAPVVGPVDDQHGHGRSGGHRGARCTQLAQAGSEIVRVTVNHRKAAAAVPGALRRRLADDLECCTVPLVGDFHYNGHILLRDYPRTAALLAKYRINPGNVGTRPPGTRTSSRSSESPSRTARRSASGSTGGSLDQRLLTEMMDANGRRENPKDAGDVLRDAIVESAVRSADLAVETGLSPNQIVLSAKVSGVRELIAVYRQLAPLRDHALHLGLTEAGMGSKGIVATAAALSPLLMDGIGDTIRVSLTPRPGGDRAEEVRVAQQILQSLEIRSFEPQVTACPGCGRTTSTFFQEMTEDVQGHIRERMPEWRRLYPGVEDLKVAVMGCVVNGPGESKHADLGISLPGNSEAPKAPVYADGAHLRTLKGDRIVEEFKEILDGYVARRYARS